MAPSASKLKKLKAALDCCVVDVQEYSADPHAIAGRGTSGWGLDGVGGAPRDCGHPEGGKEVAGGQELLWAPPSEREQQGRVGRDTRIKVKE